MASHGERKHAKFAASSAERYFQCPGSIALSEGVAPKDNKYSVEGTLAHEVLESVITMKALPVGTTLEMIGHAKHAADHILKIHQKSCNAELLVEKKVYLDFIHPEAFGTLDYAVVEHFGTLHVLDFKYGKKWVSPVQNLQFLFYALAVGYKYDWNFKKVRMWTLQPRVSGFDGNYSFWEISIQELKDWVSTFQAAISRIEKKPNEYVEGSWCFFCVVKTKCPLKQELKTEKAMTLFSKIPIQRGSGNDD